jgi:hypothetical protein
VTVMLLDRSANLYSRGLMTTSNGITVNGLASCSITDSVIRRPRQASVQPP